MIRILDGQGLSGGAVCELIQLARIIIAIRRADDV